MNNPQGKRSYNSYVHSLFFRRIFKQQVTNQSATRIFRKNKYVYYYYYYYYYYYTTPLALEFQVFCLSNFSEFSIST